MARDDVLVRALPLGDQWQGYGTEAGRGIWPSGVKLGADDWGPHDFSCSLMRDPQTAFADLQAATPLEVEIGGSLLWSGRVNETPGSEVQRQIGVQAEGWQFHLDDDVFQKTYVHSALSDLVDVRTLPSAQLGQGAGFHPAAYVVSTDTTGVTMLTPINVACGGFEGASVQYDMGPNNVAVRMVADIDTSANTTAMQCYGFIGTDPRPQQGTSNTMFGINCNGNATNLGSGVTAATPGRYVSVRMQCGTAFTPGADVWVKVKRLLIFTVAAYESSGVSVLFASTVAKDALTHAPLVSADQSLIATTAFAIPDLVMSTYQTPRQVWTAANAYHNYQARIRADYRPEYRPRPSTSLLTLVSGTFEDTSAGSLDQVYNRCAGIATGPDGVQIVSNQVPSPDTTIPGRRGFTKTNVLDTNMSLTQAALDQIASVFVQSHLRTPFKGTLTVIGFEALAFTVGGAFVPVWELLQYVGEMIHFPNMVDPDTGAKGRDGRISAVSYDHDTRTASVSIDSQRANFEALLARLQVVTGQVS